MTCEYKKILVNNTNEHNDAFELLEMWLVNSFKKYKKTGLVFMYEKVEDDLIEYNNIDIDSIKELDMCNFGHNNTISQQEVWYIEKVNELIQTVKQLNREIQELKGEVVWKKIQKND